MERKWAWFILLSRLTLFNQYKYINSSTSSCADLAQLVERVAFNHVVVGSSPTVGDLNSGDLNSATYAWFRYPLFF